jgi:hypothetical protein
MPSKLYSLVGLHDQQQKLGSSSDVFELPESKPTFFSQTTPVGVESKPTFFSQSTTVGVETHDGDKLKVFWSRALTCVIAPMLVTGYYIGLWLHWMSSYDAGGPIPQGPPGGRWAYYTW